MKKLILGISCLALLASCNIKNSDEYKRLEAERDSLKQINNTDDQEITELLSIVNEVEENFAQIKEAEKYLNLEYNAKGEMNPTTKEKVRSNFGMINEILKKNKEDIESLNKKLKASNNTNNKTTAALKQTIARLEAELEQRTAAINELSNLLAQKDAQISSLTTEVKELAGNVQNLTTKTTEQAEVIKEQDVALNTGYYLFGTTKELKDHKILSGGFLSSPKVIKESIDKSIFVRIDIRDVTQIPVYAKKAKVLSDQPASSYTIIKDNNGQAVIKILDNKKFWAVSPYLIVQVD